LRRRETRSAALKTSFGGLETRFETPETSLAAAETRFETLETHFARLEGSFETVENALDGGPAGENAAVQPAPRPRLQRPAPAGPRGASAPPAAVVVAATR